MTVEEVEARFKAWLETQPTVPPVPKKPKRNPRERTKAGQLIVPRDKSRIVFDENKHEAKKVRLTKAPQEAEAKAFPKLFTDAKGLSFYGRLSVAERIRLVREKQDSGAALSLLEEFVSTVNQYRREAGGFHRLSCGVYVHLEPQLAEFFAGAFTRLTMGEKSEQGRAITAGQALGLERQGKSGRAPRELETEPRNRLIAKQIADLACSKIAAGMPKKKGNKLTRGKAYGMLRTFLFPAKDQGETAETRTRYKELRQAAREVANHYGIGVRTANKYFNEYLKILGPPRKIAKNS